MQQYFVDFKIKTKDIIKLNDDSIYHLKKVLRKDNKYIFRVCDNSAQIYFAHLINNDLCEILDNTNENNELEDDITCIISLIKADKLELTIQKLVELGVKRIVLYNARRSVVKFKDNKKIDRIRKIVLEASEQSHRNIVPEVSDCIDLKDIVKYKSDNNFICYESEKNIKDIDCSGSITYIIGPEGGFELQEYKDIVNMGFESISLGKRILRAETAAMYMTSIIVSKKQ